MYARGMALISTNPTTGAQLASYREMTPTDVAGALDAAVSAFHGWRRASFADRAMVIRGVARTLRTRKSELARLMALEMGKPLNQGEGEIEKCATTCDYFAEHAEHFLAPEDVTTEARRSFVVYQPLGVVLGVMPWNFPFWQALRYAVPTVMAGNTTILKHSSNVTGCALAIEDLFDAAGSPTGVFRTLRLGSARIADVIGDPRVAAVTLTGSTPAGQAIARQAGEALKPAVLELGGSDPYVILDDADLDAAVATCVASRLINSGQSCVAAKRFISHAGPPCRSRAFVHRADGEANKWGSPRESGCGPAGPRRPARRPPSAGARQRRPRRTCALLGGTLPDTPGAFYPADCPLGVRKGHACV